MWEYNYICHHGIKGQKWGVRRYQNEDGTLTAKGKLRYAKVASSDRLQRRDTRLAKKVYREKFEKVSAYAEGTSNAASRQYKRASKFEQKAATSKELGNLAKSFKYDSKADAARAKAELNAKSAKVWMEKAEILSQKIQNINDGTLKAGRDFIASVDYRGSFYIPGVMGYIQKNISIIEKKKDE